MLCERCNKKKATVFYRENIAGRVRALRLCGDCTEVLEAAGELEDISAAVAGFASPLFRAEEGAGIFPTVLPTEGRAGGLKCPLCGMSAADISAAGKVGCAACYDTFGESLGHLVQTLHGKGGHVGHTSAKARVRREQQARLVRLRGELKEAVVAERYETAATLRDEIRAVESAVRA